MKIIRQRDYKDCGVCSLLSIIEYYGGKVSLEQLRLDAKVSIEGTTALNIVLTAKKYGFDSIGAKVNGLDDIKRLPAIAHINLKNGGTHYVVIYKITKEKVILMDPAKGKVVKHKEEFIEEWSKVVLLFYPRQMIPILKKENSLLSIFMQIIKTEKQLVIWITLISLFLTISTIIGGYYFQVIGNAINEHWDLSYIKILVVVFGFLVVIKLALSYFRILLENHLNKNIDVILNADFLNHLFHLPLEVLTSRTSGEIVTRVSELANVKGLVTDLFISFSLDFSLMLISVPLLINISGKLFLILFLSLLSYLLIGIISSKIIYKKAYCNIEYEAEFNNVLIEDINMINSIKNLGVTENRLQHLEKTLTTFLYDNFKFNKVLNIDKSLKNIISEIGFFLITTIGFYLILNNKLALVELVTFNTLLGLFFNPLAQLIDNLPKYNFLKATITKLNDFLSIDIEKEGKEEILNNINIKINNLKYSYNKYEIILENINLEIAAGSLVSLCGASGSGKSTICKILDKYINDYEGEVLIGDINIKDLSTKTIRENILYVNQQEELFTGTIKENILMNRDKDFELFNKVCNICAVDKIVSKRPLRYESMICSEGANISGGEAQRIILARALLKPFKILILDEALSEVDKTQEKNILMNIKKYFKDKTIIYITHKKHLNIFDQVIKIGGSNALP